VLGSDFTQDDNPDVLKRVCSSPRRQRAQLGRPCRHAASLREHSYRELRATPWRERNVSLDVHRAMVIAHSDFSLDIVFH
jgi:hypothetical protein